MCILGDYRIVIEQKEKGLRYQDMTVPRKNINAELQKHQGGLRPVFAYMELKNEIKRKAVKSQIIKVVS